MINPINFLTPKTTFKNINFTGTKNYADRTINTSIQSTPEVDAFECKTRHLKKGQFLDRDNIIYNYGATSMFRPDINWANFGDYLECRFKEQKKVNTIVYACSDGSEPYSVSILLQNKFKNNAKNFFPIKAKDIDENTIEENIAWQKQKETVYEDAVLKAIAQQHLLEDNICEYIKPDNTRPSNGILSEKTKKPVKFSCANILEDLENIDTKNPSLIMCRNMWPYVRQDEYEPFAKALFERLAPGSVVVIGAFDYTSIDETMANFPTALKNAGFKEAKTNINPRFKLIFEKE